MQTFKTERIDRAIRELLDAVSEQPGLTTVQLSKGVGEDFYKVTLNHSREYRLTDNHGEVEDERERREDSAGS